MPLLQKKISYNLQNLLGWRSKTKILVIESDDWGSIRMHSKQSFNNMLNAQIPVDRCPYNSIDSLENNEDMEALYDVLTAFQDHKGNHLKFTANMIMANPDFSKIRTSGFNEYHYEKFTDTYQRINGDLKVFNLIHEGVERSVFIPQLHGREHIHVPAWLKALKEGHKETILAFDNEVWGHPTNYFSGSKMNFSSSFQTRNPSEEAFARESIKDAAKIFLESFGYTSESFIAPRYIWSATIEKTLSEVGVRYIQGKIVQLLPKQEQLSTKIHLMGSKNKYGQIYLARNVFFEPSQKPSYPWMKNALERIKIAFYWGKPAVISMHRLNFMGGLNENNRKNNLNLLRQLIAEVQKQYPDVVFLSTNELGKLIENGK